MAINTKKKIGEILISKGFINEDTLLKAIDMQKIKQETKLADILIGMGAINEFQKTEALAAQKNYPFLQSNEIEVNIEMLKKAKLSDMTKYRFVPTKEDDITAYMLIDDEPNMDADDLIRNTYGKMVEYAFITTSDMTGILKKYVEPELKNKELDKINRGEEKKEEVFEISDINAPDIIGIVNQIFFDAFNDGASDVHILPRKDDIVVKYRVDGRLRQAQTLTKTVSENIVSRIKTMAKMDIANRLVPGDGKIFASVKGKKLDMRVSTLPTVQGEKVVVRLMDSSENMVNLDVLGFPQVELNEYKKLINKSQGIILITGPTGSGKSTTLYSSLYFIDDGTKNITTAENPVEYYMNNIAQSQVNEKAGLKFMDILKAMLRQDPDVIMVGEIRDRETADIAVQAANTGHLVFATVHANDAASSITRLVDMGVRPFMVAESVLAVLSQRLVRKLCPHCKRKIHLKDDDPLVNEFNLFPNEREVYEAVGCTECKNVGYKGRTTISELLMITDEIKDLIYKGESSIGIKKHAVTNGMNTIQVDAKKKAIEGITTFDEIRKYM